MLRRAAHLPIPYPTHALPSASHLGLLHLHADFQDPLTRLRLDRNSGTVRAAVRRPPLVLELKGDKLLLAACEFKSGKEEEVG